MVGTTARLEKKGGRLGLGFYELEPIAKGRTSREYSGELISQKKADIREQEGDAAGMDRDYMIEVEGLLIDATIVGGCVRCANHSCNGNAEFEINTFDKDGKVAIVRATRDIEVGETIEAYYKFEKMDWYKKCECHEVNCRKWDVLVLEDKK